MESIKLNSGVKKIQVNEKGEYITFPMNNQEFVDKVYHVLSDLMGKETKESVEAIAAEENIEKKMKMASELSIKFLNSIDEIFGKGSCKKIFSEIYEYDSEAVPDVAIITEFFEQLIPLIKKYGQERNRLLNEKYSPYKKGARK